MDISFLSPVQQRAAKDIIERCAKDRVYFVTEVLGVEQVEDWQLQCMQDLDAGETKLSIRSGHGVGKTAFCSWMAIHFLMFRDDVKVIVTSPSAKQMSDGLIPEIQKWLDKAPSWMTSSIESTSERVTRNPSPRNNFISFRTARKENPEALAGVHATAVLIIVDEASGVDEVIYETGQGALSTDGAIAILIGNPTRPTGFFHKTQTVLSDLWKVYHVSCLDSSRVALDYIEGQRRTYGEDSREYRVRVLGEFPESGADAVIPRSFVESAIGRDIPVNYSKRYWGVDPGRGGDPTGFIERTDNAVLEVAELRYDNVMLVVGWVKSKWDKTPKKQRPENIFVDVIGLGAGVADRLEELGLPVIKVNVAEAPSVSGSYVRLRDELWYNVRSWFEGLDVVIPLELDREKRLKLTEELSAPESIIRDSSGKIEVESKKSMKSRGVPSPNLADGLCLTFALGGAIQSGSMRALGGWGKVDTLSYRPPGVV